MTKRLICCLLIVLLAAPGCRLIYRQNTQQGNALEQEDLDELYIGMNKRQVLFVLGTPSIKDPFHDDRWDYVQTFSRRGGPMVQRTVTLMFEDDLLETIIGLDEPFSEQLDDGLRGLRQSSSAPAEEEDDSAPDALITVIPDDPASEDDADAATTEPAAAEPVEPDVEGLGERESETRDFEEDTDSETESDSDG
jgi:outer membrane protein assembly factor BamE